ncbi:hypothetical protein GGI21_004178, partial [Coemansia aciculifera]
PPSAPDHPQAADAVSAAEDDDEDDDEEDGAYADADDSQKQHKRGDSQNPFDSLAWISPSESGAQKQPQQQSAAVPPLPVSAPAPAPPASTVAAQPALQIQTQLRSTPNDDSQAANKTTRSRRGTNAARYVPGVGFVSEDGVNATSPQLVASASNAAAAVAAAQAAGGSLPSSSSTGALRGVQSGSVVRTPATSGRMSPMSSVVRMSSPGPRSQSPLVMSATTAGDRRLLDKDQLSKLQASLSAGPTENIERSLVGLAHDSLVSLAAAAIIERRRTVDSAVEWNKAVDKVLSTYDLIAGQIGSLKSLCESHDLETARLEELLRQSTQESMKWQEHCCRLSSELEALKLGGGGPSQSQSQSQPPRVSLAASSAAAPPPPPPPGSSDPSSLAMGNGSSSMWSMSEQAPVSMNMAAVDPTSPWGSLTANSVFGNHQQQSAGGYYGQQQSFAGGHGLLPPGGSGGGYMTSASSYAAAVAAIQAQAIAQQQHQQQQQQRSMFAAADQQQPMSGGGDLSLAAVGGGSSNSSSLLTALNARSQAF